MKYHIVIVKYKDTNNKDQVFIPAICYSQMSALNAISGIYEWSEYNEINIIEIKTIVI